MPVMRCSGEGCERLISVSAVEHGNPHAVTMGWETTYACCETCGWFWCETCVVSGQACPRCDRPTVARDVRHALPVMLGAWTHGVVATVSLRPRNDT